MGWRQDIIAQNFGSDEKLKDAVVNMADTIEKQVSSLNFLGLRKC